MDSKGIVVLALGFALAGCDFVIEKVTELAAEKAAEHALEKEGGENVDVDLSSGSLEIKTKKGSFSTGGGRTAKLPENFPKDVKLPAGKLVMSAASGLDATVAVESNESPDAVVEQVKQNAKSDGWELKSTFDSRGHSVMIFGKQGRALSVSVGAKDRSKLTMAVFAIKGPKGQ